MKTRMETESVTIILEGTIERPTDADLERIQAIEDELASKHDSGIIVRRSSKRSRYKQLTLEWRSKPKLEGEP